MAAVASKKGLKHLTFPKATVDEALGQVQGAIDVAERLSDSSGPGECRGGEAPSARGTGGCPPGLFSLPRSLAKGAGDTGGEGFRRGSKKEMAPLEALQEWLRGYFLGQIAPYPGPLDLEGATLFQEQVWLTTRMIPYGETRSYGWVARAIGHPTASRAVGQALACNPICIVIPCHRVVASSGALCGFRGGLGLKASLLALEKANQSEVQDS